MPINIILAKGKIKDYPISEESERLSVSSGDKFCIFGTNARSFYNIHIRDFALRDGRSFYDRQILINNNHDATPNKIKVYFLEDNTYSYIGPNSTDNTMTINELFIPLFLMAPRTAENAYPFFCDLLIKEGYSAENIPDFWDMVSIDGLNRFFFEDRHNILSKENFCKMYEELMLKWGLPKP